MMLHDSAWESVARMMARFGDIFVALAILFSVAIMLVSILSVFVGARPRARAVANLWAGGVFSILVTAAGLLAKTYTDYHSLPNGIFFGFSNLAVIMMLLASAGMMAAALLLPRLRF